MYGTPAGLIDALLAEDAAFGDLTTRTLGIGACPGRITFVARDDQVACGTEEAAALLRHLGAETVYILPSGSAAPAGTLLLAATGAAAALHMGWKSAQTLMEWASGIATETRAIVAAARVAHPDAVVACTRKMPPLTRVLAVRAVLAGGGVMHRINLSETILIFQEHMAFMGGKTEIGAAIRRMRSTAPERKIVVEVTDPVQAIEVAGHAPDVLQLEKFSPQQLRRVHDALLERGVCPVLAAAGGVNRLNAAAYVSEGARVLVTSAPYFAPPRDVQVTLDRA
ncbi:ModD protein [Gluconacetobacter azotocaptans]|uniref:Putative pyrophosphorylase ModD n=1 Tax=Gluconacetobacter azotocaptans TaxID=142834 RepID=A0A7W4PGV7_9PROT|nr:ModD protein [Gluconacetobacter azotocaptans]MBB2190411.1 ModD protein [Gluconacetobacter azotocaptans]MBM9400552.1 ModD protein [Gluconacetobacter azotocaptans]GBQ30164.1 nicotinate-nucleotide pyrophosphorylase [Gluconacetobacter azotocaptans DSM 13594]